MKSKTILSIILSTVLVTSSLLLINNSVQASSTLKSTVSNKTIVKNSEVLKTGIVTASYLNVRSDASLNSEIIAALKNNTSVNIIGTIGDWYKIKLDSTYGYVSKNYVKISNSNNKTQVNVQAISSDKTENSKSVINHKKGTVTASHLNVRESASLNAIVVSSLPKNANVEVIDSIENWYKIQLGSNYGYVSSQYIKIK